MTPVQTLSALIAGEAAHGNAADQFGVASVIANRAGSNYQGLGDVFGQAFNHSQFQAYPGALGTPTPYTDQLAEALASGNLSSMGNTGNALFYNAPNYNPAYAAGVGNNFGPGSNQYSDVFNQTPTSNLVMPQASDNTAVAVNGAVASEGESGDWVGINNTGEQPDGSMFDVNSGFGSLSSSDANSLGIPALEQATPGTMGSASTDTSAANPLGFGTSGATDTAPVTANVTTGAIPGLNASPAPPSSTAAQGSGQDTTGGQPIQNNISDATSIGQTGLNAVSKSVNQAGSDIQGAEGNLAAAGTSWLGSLFGAGTNVLVRGGFIFLGLVVLLGAFLFFYVDSQRASS